MHELSLCRALIKRIEGIANEHQAQAVKLILIHLGPLSGAEAPLLRHAYPLAAAGTIAEMAELLIKQVPIRVRCPICSAESSASINQLFCNYCGNGHTQLIGGDEIELVKLEFDLSIH